MYQHFRRNWLSWCALVSLIFVFFNVKQVRNLFELPHLGLSNFFSIAGAFYGFVGVLVVLYCWVGWWVVPFDQKKLSVISPGTDSGVRHLIERRQRALAVVAGILGAMLLGVSLFVDGPYLLDKSVLRSFGILATFAAVMVKYWRNFAVASQRMLLRSLFALIGLNLLGELLWFLADAHAWFSPRNYSLWAILHIFFCVFLFARVIDVWQSYSGFPLRFLALFIVVVAIGWAGPTPMGELRDFSTAGLMVVQPPGAQSATADDDADIWLKWVQRRLAEMPADGPVIFVAASGGGSRASLFTSLVYHDLEQQTFPLPNGKVYRPADHIVLISSVSGGTLASSCFLDTDYTKRRTEEGERKQLNHSIKEEMIQLMSPELDELKNLPWYRRVNPDTNEVIADFVEQARAELKTDDLPPFGKSPFVDDMCMDFMAPLLRGALHPGRDRSQSVSQYWQLRFGMKETNLDWQRRWQNGQIQAIPPVLLNNVSEVEQGSRLIIGFPPMPPGFFDRTNDRSVRSWVDLDTKKAKVGEISIAEATRLSASFPWGFPVGSIAIPQYDQFAAESQGDVHLIDGGVCDNTGIDSIRYVIEALNMWDGIEVPGDPVTKRRKEAAGAILKELRQRGVVLLEIDSGAKPVRPGWVARFLSGILEPVSALQNSSYATATAAVKSHMHVVNEILPNSQAQQLTRDIERLRIRQPDNQSLMVLSVDDIVNVRRLTITCNHQENVMTAWALGPTDKAQVFVRFLVGSKRFGYEFREYLDEYFARREGLESLRKTVAGLDVEAVVNPEKINEIIEARNDLFEMSQSAEGVARQRIGAEKMFYQGVTVPNEVLRRVDDEVLSKSKWRSKLPDDVVPNAAPETQPETPLNQPSNALPQVQQYEMLQNAVQKLDYDVKRRRVETLDRIKELEVQ